MLKTYTLILLLLLSAYCSQAQKIRFTDTTNEWTYVDGRPWWSSYYVIVCNYKGDSTYKGVHYLQLHSAGHLKYLVREDTVAEKVFYIAHDDTTERVLYDLTLNKDDTFHLSPECDPAITLWNKDSVLINGVYHTTQRFGTFFIIEGIGNFNEVIRPWCLHPDMYTGLVCFKNKGAIVNIPHKDGIHFLLSASSCKTSVDDINKTDITTTPYPNPIDNTSVLRFSKPVSGTLSITNTLGKVINTTVLYQKEEVNIGSYNYTPGIYYYQLRGDAATLSGKFVCN